MRGISGRTYCAGALRRPFLAEKRRYPPVRNRQKGAESSTGTQTMKIVVIGGTGLIGSKTVAILRRGGHEVVAASPNSGVNTITGEGVKEAVAGAQW